MNTILGTSLEYSDADKVAIEFYLGEGTETMEEWGQRIASFCEEYSATDGKGNDGKGMPSVYARSAEDLWTEKKIRRRVSFMMDFASIQPNDLENDFFENASAKFAAGQHVVWSDGMSDEAVITCGASSDYKTQTARWHEEEASISASQQAALAEIQANIDTLHGEGYSDATIKIIYPKSQLILT